MRILALIVLLFTMFSCGSRERKKDKEVIKEHTESISDVKVKRDSFSLSESESRDLTIKIKPKPNATKDCESKVIVVTDDKGNRKEIPVFLDSDIEISDKSDIEKKLDSVTIESDRKDKLIKDLEREVLNIDVKSDKGTFWLYVLCFVVGIAIIPTIKLLLKR